MKNNAKEHSDPIDNRNAHERLLAVMDEVSYIQKDRSIGTGNNAYMVVSHDAVTAKVRPVLVKHGLVYYPQNLHHVQNGNRTEITLDIVFVNVRDPSDKISVPTLGYGIDSQDKGPGKAVSYAVKLALLKALGLETGLDADDDANVEHAPSSPPQAQTVAPLSRAEARPEYTRLVTELQQMQTPAELSQWGATNKARMMAMPEDWQQFLRNEYIDHRRSLEQRTAA